jgi:hypothetical protein
VESVRGVSGSPCAVTNVLIGVSGLAKAGILQLDGRWQPAEYALNELDRVILHGVQHDLRR